MAAPRLVAGLVLVLAGGCIQFEHAPTTDTSDAPGTTTGEQEEPAPEVTCDPLSQDCPDGQACAPTGGGFACVEVLVDGVVGDGCLAAGECGPGLACVSAAALAGCDAQGGCCSSLCDVSDAGADCGEGEVCGPVFAGEEVPPMWADYGVCQLPG